MSAQPNGAGVELADFDLRAQAGEGFWLQLTDPRSLEPIPVRLRLRGADAEACYMKFRAVRRARSMQLIGRAAEEDVLAAELELAVAATVDWEGLKVSGEAYAYAPERVREFYTRWLWALDLAVQAIGNRANFSTGSSSS